MDSGEARLKALGYKQELKRDFTLVSNAAISFSIISTLLGITGSLPVAYNNGGAPTAVWGWILACSMTMTVALSMVEIVSSLPSSGWFNLLGQVAITAGIDFTLANQIACMWALSNGTILSPQQLLAVYAVVLVIHGLVNSFSTRILAYMSTFSAGWHFVGGIVVTILLPCVAPTHQSASFVFTDFQGVGTTTSGVGNNAYIFFLGMLMAQFTLTGYDACGHMNEETVSADKTAALGIVLAVGCSSIAGLLYVLALMFSVQDPGNLLTGNANGYVGGQIYFDAFNARFGSGIGGIIALGVPTVAAFCCGAMSVASNSRQATTAQDLTCTQTPLWAMVTLAFILALPLLYSTVAFSAVISISTVGLYISYGIPILMRLINHKDFEPGPFNLGKFGPIMHPTLPGVRLVNDLRRGTQPITKHDQLEWAAVPASGHTPHAPGMRQTQCDQHTLEDIPHAALPDVETSALTSSKKKRYGAARYTRPTAAVH
ncbi:g11771 [Coccomyxa viridis]|uniref:G11771 protein n=1 Tax=Coccomyxa viridis TaxID=1274662 RepID=A0ABP1GED7_9CHLO